MSLKYELASVPQVMFSVTALRRPIRITNLHMASGSWRRELYRVSRHP